MYFIDTKYNEVSIKIETNCIGNMFGNDDQLLMTINHLRNYRFPSALMVLWYPSSFALNLDDLLVL